MTIAEDLTPDLTRTVALLGDGYRITQLARAKRAQEINERDEQLQPVHLQLLRRDRELDPRDEAPPVLGRGRGQDAAPQARGEGDDPRHVGGEVAMLSPITLTTDDEARALARSHYRHKARVASIVEDAAELVDTAGADAYVSISVHHDDLLAAALDLPGAERHDFTSSDTGRPAVSCRLGRVTFFAAVRL